MKKISMLGIVLIIGTLLFGAQKTYMGVVLDEISVSELRDAGSEKGNGIKIKIVSDDSPAQKAGLKENDIILTFDRENIYSISQIKKMLSMKNPEDKVEIQILREKKIKKISITLDEIEDPNIVSYMGIYQKSLSPKMKKKLDFDKDFGALIKVVNGGPADKASMKDDDIILKMNDEKIYTQDQLTRILEILQPEETVKVTVFRDKKEIDLNVTLGERKLTLSGMNSDKLFFGDKSNVSWSVSPENVVMIKKSRDKWIGVELNIVQNITKTMFKNTEDYIVTIEKVIKDSPAEKAGLKKDDVIIKANGKELSSDYKLVDAIQDTEVGKEIELTIKRGKKEKSFSVIVEKRKDTDTENVEVIIDGGNIKINDDEIFNIDEIINIPKIQEKNIIFDDVKMKMNEVKDKVIEVRKSVLDDEENDNSLI